MQIESAVMENKEKKYGDNYVTSRIQVTGLDCMDCATKLKIKIEQFPGVAEVQMNFALGIFTVIHDCPDEELIHFINSNGYPSSLIEDDTIPTVSIAKALWLKFVLVILAVLLIAAGFIGPRFGVNKALAVYFFPAAMLIGGYNIYKAAWNSVKSLVLDINVLMTVSSIGALIIKQWSEAATVMVLFNVGNILQSFTFEKTRNSIKQMIEMSPQEARVITKFGYEEVIPVEQVKIGDIVLIKPGEYVPVDGEVISGMSWVNQASITGEANPVEKKEGDQVFAGTINTEGSFQVKVRHIAKDSTLSKMIHMVEEAQNQKAPIQQFIDVFAKYYTPVVLIGAFLAVLIPVAFFNQPFNEWFYKALIILVIACPCALVISTPVSIVSAIGNAANNGVLVKGGAYLEALGKTVNLAFDKTGTLTTGKLSVFKILPVSGTSEEELLTLAAAVESYSEHPIAKAIIAETKSRKMEVPESYSFISYPGKGARSRLEDQYIHVGNKKLLTELEISTDMFSSEILELEKAGFTVIYVALDYILKGIIAVADAPREGAKAMIEVLKDYKLNNIFMLSGDNESTVSNIAGLLGIELFRSELLPEDKVNVIKELNKDGVTVMIGDGVNDAPALATATVGIAMGAAGSDTALDTADIALMDDDLVKIPSVIRLGKATNRIIRENVVISVGLKLLFLILTLLGMSNLWMAVFADVGASLIVTINGMRLTRFEFDG